MLHSIYSGKIYLLQLLSSLSFTFYLQAQEMSVRIYTAKDGLPSNMFTVLHRISLGIYGLVHPMA
jgi:hypothetical protein